MSDDYDDEIDRKQCTDQLGRPLSDPRYRFDPDAVTKGYGAPVTQPRAAAASMEWTAYINRQIQKESSAREKAMAAALAQTLGKDLVAVERECAALRAEVAELRERQVELDNEIDEMIRRQRASAQFDELNERLRQLEEMPAGRLRLLG